jgi:hypothetical protein
MSGESPGHLFELAPAVGEWKPELAVAFFGSLRYLPKRGVGPFHARPRLAFELHADCQRIRCFLWCEAGATRLLRDHVEAMFPAVHLSSAPEPYPRAASENRARLMVRRRGGGMARGTAIGDPLLPMLLVLSGLASQERAVVQLVVRPCAKEGGRGSGAAVGWAFDAVAVALGLAANASAREALPEPPDFVASLRVCTEAADTRQARARLMSLRATLDHLPWGRSLWSTRPRWRAGFDAGLRARALGSPTFFATARELADLFHLPMPPVKRLVPDAPAAALVPADAATSGKILALVEARGAVRSVAIKPEDERQHLHVLGGTGTGKTTLLANLAYHDAVAGHGFAILDPKGDLVDAVLPRIPEHRIRDVVLIDPSDTLYPVGLNALACWGEVDREVDREIICDYVVTLFRKLYDRYWGPRSDDLLKAAILTLLDYPGATLAEVPLLLSSAEFRARFPVDEPVVLGPFWRSYEQLSDTQRTQAIAPLLNKVRDFLLRRSLRNILGQSQSRVNFRTILDGRKILLVNLAKGLLGEDTSRLLGALILSALWQAAQSRANVPEDARADFRLILDEFPNYLSLPQRVEDVLAEARSFRLGLVLAHQHLRQLPLSVRQAVLANARTRIVFQCSQEDALVLGREFGPAVSAADLRTLARFHAAIRLCVDGSTRPAFIGRTPSPPPGGDPAVAERIRRHSRAAYGRPRQVVEDEIRNRLHLQERANWANEDRPRPLPEGSLGGSS